MDTNITSPMKYLDKAVNGLRDMGLDDSASSSEEPIIHLLNQISDLDEDKVLAIARTLSQGSLFNQVVREQVSSMNISDRYEGITAGFNSIRDDAKTMVDQIDDDKIDTLERISNVWMKVTRGDISTRFDGIKEIYLDVSRDTQDQIEREHKILEAYRDYRGAIKQAEVLSFDVLKIAEDKLSAAKDAVEDAMKIVTNAAEDIEPAERARFELDRDEKVRLLQNEEKRYQIAKDLSDNLTVSYNTTEVVMARLAQTTNAKERVYSQSVSFFSTNETVLTALSASFTGMWGLHESTEALNAMKDGINQSIEVLSEVGGKVQKAALEAGYGPNIQASSVKMLVDSVVKYQEDTVEIISEMRKASTRNAEEISESVEDGKRRLAKLAQQGNTLEGLESGR